MQGLSSRAHAFSVEALVGKPCKRMKVSEESSSAADTDSDTSIFTGLSEHPVSRTKKVGPARRRTEDTSCEPDRQSVGSGGEEAKPSGEEDKPKERDCRPDREVRVELQGSELWKRFYEIGTEMIITKAGRRMFPSVRVKVRNLDPCQQYYVAMDVMPVDSKRYRYVYHSSQWMVAGNTDHSCISPRLYVHPDSPCAGETWMRQVISFDRVKLTNNEMDDKGHITKLKIDRNPFAKGFRDPGRNRGVLDGLLESYPWRGPLSLDFKPFTIQLQGGSGSPASSAKTLLPLSSSSSLPPFSFSPLSCQDAALNTLALPLYGKASAASPSSPLPSRAFSSLGADRLRGLPPLSPLADFPLLSALHAKKPPHCRDPCLHGSPGNSSCLLPLHGPLSPQGPSLFPHLSDTTGPYCLYRYSFPLSPQLAAISRHAKLAEDTTNCLLRQSPWHPTTNHCL
ncbi:T-box transcription factor TBX22 isoform X3 [Acanthopagrus latus]|uniref:T-box transcription factor TBX22 isoform X3 n=1 Tax=Acanthopagrus latus TaxID=8177 RepID=UPI00187C8F65|nr:T-box transcription factor TBX22 isoform X3 [Acanthopagrus latus]